MESAPFAELSEMSVSALPEEEAVEVVVPLVDFAVEFSAEKMSVTVILLYFQLQKYQPQCPSPLPSPSKFQRRPLPPPPPPPPQPHQIEAHRLKHDPL